MLMQTSVPVKRLKETHRMACRLLRLVQAQQNDINGQVKRPTIKTRVLACMVGRIVATFRGIRGARRHLIFLQHALGQAVRRSGWNSVTPLSKRRDPHSSLVGVGSPLEAKWLPNDPGTTPNSGQRPK
jgi:hypothetical protein